MTPAVLERPGSVTERTALGGGGTLEERLSAVLDEARANGSAECPVCHARMAPAPDGTADCGGCGGRLS